MSGKNKNKRGSTTNNTSNANASTAALTNDHAAANNTTQTDDLAQLKAEVARLRDEMNKIKQDMLVTKNENNILKREVDRLEQYGRRHSVVIRGIPAVEDESTADLTEKVKNVLRNDLSIKPEIIKDFDKTHRIGKVFETEEGARRQDVILRMKSHSARYNIYDNRKNSKSKKISISPSLTTHRSKLLRDAKRLYSEAPPVDFIYTDVHGDTKVRLKNAIDNKYAFKFYAIEELEAILEKCQGTHEDDEL